MGKYTGHPITDDSALGGSVIERSLRFNDDDNPYLNKTFSGAGNTKTFTISFWFKMGSIPDSASMNAIGTGTNNQNDFMIGFSYDGSRSTYIHVLARNSGSTVVHVSTNRRFRDSNAWYHAVISVDTTQSTSSDRVKIYINGSQETSLSNSTYPSQNTDLRFNSANAHYVGTTRDDQTSTGNFDGYMTEVNAIDGAAYDPTYFGFTESQTGLWKPKRYEGTYGTNGFHLDFSDNSNTSSLGIDKSPNGHDFTANNFSVAAGKTNDSLEDTPTNNFCTISSLDIWRTGNTVAEGGLKLTRTGANFGNARCTMAVNSGKWYYEWECTGQHTQVGWVNVEFDLGYNGGDVAVTSGGGGGVGMYWDSRTYMYGWQNSGGNTYFPSSGSFVSYTTGDIIMVAVDLDTFKFWFGKNGTWINVLGTADPAAGTDGITPVASKNNGTYEAGMYFTPLISCFSNGNGHVNFGQRPFSYTIPSGYKTLQTRNIPLTVPSIVRPQKHFDSILYTGNDGSQTITGLEFDPDLVWAKNRQDAGYHHDLYDTVRGNNLRIFSSQAQAEATGYLQFGATGGFSLTSGGGINANNKNHVAWCWKAGGAAVTNNDGSVASQVSANTEAGFSIVTLDGTGSVLTFGHGLGAKPSMVMLKARNIANNWLVYHKSYGAEKTTFLDTATATSDNAQWYNDTEPTSSVFTLGTWSGMNTASSNIVAYCWTEIPGYSKFGSYTGNGSTDGTFVNLGFRAAFIMIKSSSLETNWNITTADIDSYNVVTKYLDANTSGAEGTYTFLDILSNGFKARNVGNSFNQNGASYIYMAFAEQPGTTPFDTFPNAR